MIKLTVNIIRNINVHMYRIVKSLLERTRPQCNIFAIFQENH